MIEQVKPNRLLTFNPSQNRFVAGGANFKREAALLQHPKDPQWILAECSDIAGITYKPGVYCFAKEVAEDSYQAIYVGKASGINRRMQDYKIADRFLVTTELPKEQLSHAEELTQAIRTILADGFGVSLWVAHAHLHLQEPLCYHEVEAKILGSYRTIKNKKYGDKLLPIHDDNNICLLCQLRAVHNLLSSVNTAGQELPSNIGAAKDALDKIIIKSRSDQFLV